MGRTPKKTGTMIIGIATQASYLPLLASSASSFSRLLDGARQLVEAALPVRTERAYSYLGIADTMRSIGSAYVRFGASIGPREAYQWLRAQDPEAQGVHPRLVQIFSEEAPRWCRRLERDYGMTVQFEGLPLLEEKIPQGSLVMCAAIHHASLEPCYTLWEALPQIRPVPEAGNYLKSPFARKSGLGALLAGSGFVFIDRTNRDPSHFREVFLPRLQSAMEDHGLWPLIFITGGRPPLAFNEDGALARPGLFAKAQGRPDDYLDSGVITTALMTARRARRTVYLPLIVTEGEHLVKPKTAKSAPFIEPVTRGQTVTHRIVAVLEITHRTRIAQARREMVRLFREATGIEAHLEETVSRWGEQHDMSSAAASFAEQAAKDERLFIVADRTRSLHPRLGPANLGRDIPEISNVLPMTTSGGYRHAAQRGLLTLLVDPDPERLEATLGAVSTLVGAAEYRLW